MGEWRGTAELAILVASVTMGACVTDSGFVQRQPTGASGPDTLADNYDSRGGGPAEGPASCALPEGLDPGMTMFSSTFAFHWTSGGTCVPVSYQPSLEPFSDLIGAAIAHWNAIPCSRLQFCPATRAATVIDPTEGAQGVLHVTDQDLAIGVQNGEMNWSDGRGVISGAAIQVTAPTIVTEGDWVQLFGFGLGLSQTYSAESVMHPRTAGEQTSGVPTQADVRTVCAIYGQDPYCGGAEPF